MNTKMFNISKHSAALWVLRLLLLFFFFNSTRLYNEPDDIRRSSIIQEFILGFYPRVLRNRSWYDGILEFNWRRQSHTCYTHHLLLLLLLLLLLMLLINCTEPHMESGTGVTKKTYFLIVRQELDTSGHIIICVLR